MTTTAIADDRADALATPVASKRKHAAPELLTLAQLDGRTKASKRAYELIDQYEAKLGPRPSPIQKQHVIHAAVLSVMIENMEARVLQGEDVDQVTYAVLLNAQRRALNSF